MEIIYISKSIIPSRTANSIHVMKMCQALADNGNKVTLLAPDFEDKYEDNIKDIYDFYNVKNNFKICKLFSPKIKGRTFIYGLAVLKYLLFNKTDLTFGRFVIGSYFSSLLGIKTIFESHDKIYNASKLSKFFFFSMIKRQSFKKLIVISQVLKDLYLKNTDINKNLIDVFHDGADEINDFDSKITLRGNNKLNVSYVGHLYKGKGVEVIEFLAPLLKDVGFHIVGGTIEDIEYWKNKIKNDNVYFYGFVNQNIVKKYINTSDICILPNQKVVLTHGSTSLNNNISDFTSPLKMFEYMANKKAIVSSDLPVLREVLNENNSILVSCDNKEEWKEAINRLKDKDIRNKISKQAYEDFKLKYTWKIRAKKIIENITYDY